MCGRYTLTSPERALRELFDLAGFPEARPRFNIAPSQSVLAVRADGSRWIPTWMRWGLIPRWAKDAAIGQKMTNARAETVASKPAFREAFRKRRCLVPADGFYEWQATSSGKQPHYFSLPGQAPFALAAIWERWQPAGGEAVESVALLTTDANASVAPIHDRMPVIVAASKFRSWVDDGEAAQALCASAESPRLAVRAVSRRINGVRHDDPSCLDPPEEPPKTLFD